MIVWTASWICHYVPYHPCHMFCISYTNALPASKLKRFSEHGDWKIMCLEHLWQFYKFIAFHFLLMYLLTALRLCKRGLPIMFWCMINHLLRETGQRTTCYLRAMCLHTLRWEAYWVVAKSSRYKHTTAQSSTLDVAWFDFHARTAVSTTTFPAMDLAGADATTSTTCWLLKTSHT